MFHYTNGILGYGLGLRSILYGLNLSNINNNYTSTYMNDLLAKLFDQAIVLEEGNDYVQGELDPVKFAELIIQECAEVAGCNGHVSGFTLGDLIKEHFGVEE
jgi:hypothetical protein